MGKPRAIFLAATSILFLILVLISVLNFSPANEEETNTENTKKETVLDNTKKEIVLDISKINTSSGFKLSNESTFEANLKVEMHVNENRSMNAIKTIFLKNVGKSDRDW